MGRNNIWLAKQHPLETTDELKVALQTIWEELPQVHINKAVANFTKCLTACTAANGGHFKHLQWESVHLQVWILISAPKMALHSHPHITGENQRSKRWKLEINFCKVVQQHYVGEIGKSITWCCMLFQYSLCQIMQKLVSICKHYSKMNGGLFFFDSHYRHKVINVNTITVVFYYELLTIIN